LNGEAWVNHSLFFCFNVLFKILLTISNRSGDKIWHLSDALQFVTHVEAALIMSVKWRFGRGYFQQEENQGVWVSVDVLIASY